MMDGIKKSSFRFNFSKQIGIHNNRLCMLTFLEGNKIKIGDSNMEKEIKVIVILCGRREFANERICVGILKSTLEVCNPDKQEKVMGDNLSHVWGSNFEVIHASSSVHLIRKSIEKSIAGLDGVEVNNYRWMWETLILNPKSNISLAQEKLSEAKATIKVACEYKIYRPIVLV